MSTSPRPDGLTLRQAALIAGFAYLLNPVSYAEFFLWPKLLVAGSVGQTAANVSSHPGMLLGVFFAFFINFSEDVVIAWALYFLLAPVNKALSLLASLFQLVYASICFTGLFNLLPVYREVTDAAYGTAAGGNMPHEQIYLLLRSFRYDYSMALVLFGIHLVLVGALIVRSRYIPLWLGIVLVAAGLGWIIVMLQPYLYPGHPLDWLQVTALGELVFMLWLLFAGWRLKEPAIGA
ncbi:MAG TPA: DUF4386 domain-containing protein [Candidatus Cybelea sp.]|jgi:hypothetical protein|nr:DUF4386 domain-containing protein [Candidatus Cybelea sp.]